MITQKTFYIQMILVSIDKKLHKRRKRMIQVAYTYIKNIKRFCRSVVIHTYQRKKSEINLEYDTITFNEELSFPYSVPNSYNRIIIK
jgi:hypothetical protein